MLYEPDVTGPGQVGGASAQCRQVPGGACARTDPAWQVAGCGSTATPGAFPVIYEGVVGESEIFGGDAHRPGLMRGGTWRVLRDSVPGGPRP